MNTVMREGQYGPEIEIKLPNVTVQDYLVRRVQTQNQYKSVLIVCLLVEGMSVVQCLHLNLKMFPLQSKQQLQLPKPIVALVQVDNKFAVVQPQLITFFRVDYVSMHVSVVSRIQRSGLCYQKLLTIDATCILLVAERDVADAKDVVQTLFIRSILDAQATVVQEQVLHFDLLVHQVIKH